MSNKWNKIANNAREFKIENFYQNMTPDQYRKAIDTAIAKTRLDMANFYEKEYRKLYDDLNNEYQREVLEVIDTVSIELIYELAVQLDAFNEEDEYRRESIIERVQEIYTNVMNAIKKYSTVEKKEAEEQYTEKKKKVQDMFNLQF